MQKKGCDLNTCFLCRFCIPEWKDVINTHRQNIRFEKGRTIFREGEKVKGIYFIYSGSVKVYKQWTTDKQLILRFAKAGDILGHRGLGGDDIYPISASAIETTMLCYIPADFFESTLKINTELTNKLLHFYATELQTAEKRMRDLVHMEVKGRIAQALIEISALFGLTTEKYIDISINRQDIASYAGTTYETIFKFFRELTRKGIITISGKDIRINKPVLLQKFIPDNTTKTKNGK